MTIQEYKQQLYDACREHIFLAQQALDRYATAKTDREREYAKIDTCNTLPLTTLCSGHCTRRANLKKREVTYERKHFHNKEAVRHNLRRSAVGISRLEQQRTWTNRGKSL